MVAATAIVKNVDSCMYHATVEEIAETANKKYIVIKYVYLNTSTFIIPE